MDKNCKTILNERYKVIRPIGYGGMAEVFLAHDELLDRNVAVKMLRDQFLEDKELLEQFRREAKSAARLVHPYIINIYDVISEGSNQYIVMEYVDGVTLKEYMQEHKLSLNAVLEIGVRLADALQHAHSHNIIHCDIKPQNILIDKNMNPKIADFGIAKMVTNQTMVYSKAVMGSVHYISPEQACGGKITASSDVYSLGIVLFEMITGQVPYVGNTALSVAMMHVEKPVPQLKNYMEQPPEGLQEIINKALAKHIEDRYANAGQMRRDLLNLKMKLFPFSSEDYRQELGAVKKPKTECTDVLDDGATMIMKPLRSNGIKNQSVNNAKNDESNQNAEPKEKAGAEEVMPRKKKINYTKLLLMITAMVVAVSVAANFILNRTLAETVVPNVNNMMVVEAQKLLEEKQFKVELEEKYGEPEKFKPGTVMEQSPKAGEKRKQGSLVILTICKGAEIKPVPEIIGMSLEKARQQLETNGFKLGNVTRRYEKGGKNGAVLSQSPKGLDKMPKGSSIDVVINEGDKAVPNIIGKSVKEVNDILLKAGLKLGEIKKIQDATAKKNVVLACDPGVGSNLPEGAAVSVTISEGAKKSAYVDFVVPSGKPVKVQIILQDDNGKSTLYTGTQNGNVRLRQKVEYVGNASIKFFCDGKLINEKVF